MTIVDLSRWQGNLILDSLPFDVSGVILKATERTFTDPEFARFRAEATAARWKWVGLYHFLGEGGPAEFDHFVDTVAELGGREFVCLDWERSPNGYLPPADDAAAWMSRAEARWPGRCCWYTYRSLAIAARQSGEFPWPLWLADPNPDGHDWAVRLGAFLRQYGQQSYGGIACDVNEIIDIAALDQLTEGTDMTPDQFAALFGDNARANNGVVELLLRDGNWYPLGHVLQYIHTEAQEAHEAAGGTKPLTVNLSGTATP